MYVSSRVPGREDWHAIWQPTCQAAVLRGLDLLRREGVSQTYRPETLRPAVAEHYVQLPDTLDLSLLDYAGVANVMRRAQESNYTLVDAEDIKTYYSLFEGIREMFIETFLGTFSVQLVVQRCWACRTSLLDRVHSCVITPMTHCSMCGELWCDACAPNPDCEHSPSLRYYIDDYHQLFQHNCEARSGTLYCFAPAAHCVADDVTSFQRAHLCQGHFDRRSNEPWVELASVNLPAKLQQLLNFQGSIFDWVPLFQSRYDGSIFYNANPASPKFGWYARGTVGREFFRVVVEIEEYRTSLADAL